MRLKASVPLSVVILTLLASIMVVVGCASGQTTTTAQSMTPTTQAVTTTQPSRPTVALAPDRKSKLDEFLSQLEKNNKMMGGVAIAQNGQILYDNYLGSSSVVDGTKNGPLTKFRIGSITKMFTATMILQLIEEGRLSLDTKLAAFYPYIQNSDKITISHLLSHRSGLPDFAADPGLVDYAYSKQSEALMLARFALMKPDFQPDEQFAYSNTNYVLLGYILEDITQSTYQQALKTRIVDRIGLANTDCGSAIDAKGGDAASYTMQDGKWVLERETDMSVVAGTGAIVSTPRDLTAFIAALFDGNVISKASLDEMLQLKDGYGKGIAAVEADGKMVGYGHGGSIDAFWSGLTYLPDEKLAVALIANGADSDFNTIGDGVTRIALNLPFDVPDFAALEHLPAPTVPGTLAFAKSVGEEKADIYVVDTDGGGLRPITATSERWEEHPSWSPDGKRIVYTTAIPGDGMMDTLTVEVANADGSERARLGDGKYYFPTWSPDGKHIVLAGVVPKESTWLSLFVINPDGSGAKTLFDAEVLPFPSWAPNGDILFLRGPDYFRGWDLYSMKLDGSATIRLTTGKDIGGYALSPDGKTLAYYDRGEKAIVTMPLDAGGPSVTLLETAWLIQLAPFVALSWSPDGKAVALASSSADNDQGSPLYIVNADGSGLSQVPGIDAAYDPAWRPE